MTKLLEQVDGSYLQFGDVMAYREHSLAERRAALDELAEQAQELGLGY